MEYYYQLHKLYYKSNKLSTLACDCDGVGGLISSDFGLSLFVSNKSINSLPEVAGVALAFAFPRKRSYVIVLELVQEVVVKTPDYFQT